jgi:Protein of unknown function (DUF5818)
MCDLFNKLKTILILSTGITVGAAFSPVNSSAQEAQRQKQEQSSQQNQYRDQSQSPQQNQQQQEIQSYRGQLSSKHGKFYLEEARSRSSYVLEDTWEAKRFLNKKVRVTGWLDADQGILHVVSLSPAP